GDDVGGVAIGPADRHRVGPGGAVGTDGAVDGGDQAVRHYRDAAIGGMRWRRGPAIEAARVEAAAGDQLGPDQVGAEDHGATGSNAPGGSEERGLAAVGLVGKAVAAMRKVEIDQRIGARRRKGADFESEGELHQWSPTSAVAVVPVALTRLTRSGSSEPPTAPAMVTSSPEARTSARSPEAPIHRPRVSAAR